MASASDAAVRGDRYRQDVVRGPAVARGRQTRRSATCAGAYRALAARSSRESGAQTPATRCARCRLRRPPRFRGCARAAPAAPARAQAARAWRAQQRGAASRAAHAPRDSARPAARSRQACEQPQPGGSQRHARLHGDPGARQRERRVYAVHSSSNSSAPPAAGSVQAHRRTAGARPPTRARSAKAAVIDVGRARVEHVGDHLERVCTRCTV